jgi:hypothetical protein
MAAGDRHAAWQSEKTFAVQVLAERGEPTDLAGDLPDFLAASDVAFDWLNREDPDRSGSVSLAIVERGAETSRTVWSYPPAAPAPAPGPNLVELFGFDPTAWRPPSGAPPGRGTHAGRLADVARRRPPLAERPAGTPPPAPAPPPEERPAAAAPPPPYDPPAPRADRGRPDPGFEPGDDDDAPESVAGVATGWKPTKADLATLVRGAREDKATRALLIFSAVALWFAVALVEPGLLALLLVSLPAALVFARRACARPEEEIL